MHCTLFITLTFQSPTLINYNVLLYRVPKDKKGPLGTFWKARDEEGYVINYDGTRSACVHQWDRWFDELQGFIDTHVF